MAVELVDIKLYDEFTGSGGGGTKYLLGVLGDKITAELTFDVYWATEEVDLIFTAAGDTIERDDNGSFIDDGFKVGDTIVTDSPTNPGPFTITAISDSIITVAEALADESWPDGSVFGETPVTAIDYFFNLIENNAPDDFDSLTDLENAQMYTASGLDPTAPPATTAMTPVGNSMGWQQSGLTVDIDTVSFTNHRQRFTVTHEFFITPLFRPDQIQNIRDGIPPAPDYFGNRKALRYAAKIDAKFTDMDPEIPHTSDFEMGPGNTGWFDELANGRAPKYELLSITYTDDATAAVVDGLQSCRKTNVDIRLSSVGLFTAGQKMVLNQMYLPLDSADFINTKDTDLIANFRFDRAFLTEGAAAIDGEQFGTDAQSITDAQAVLIGVNEMKITYSFDPAAAYTTFIGGKDDTNRNYAIFVTPQLEAITTTEEMDRTAVLCDTQEYLCDTDDAALWVIEDKVKIYKSASLYTDGRDTIEGFDQDQLVARAQFKVASNQASPGLLTKMEVKIEAEHATEDPVELQVDSFSMADFPADCDDIQEIDLTVPLNYTYDSEDPRNYISFQRVPASDTGVYRFYQMDYPFKLRWEKWRQLAEAAKCFQPATQDWSIYALQSGWSLKMNIYATVEADGVETLFKHQIDMVVKGRDVSFDGITVGELITYRMYGSPPYETDLEGQLSINENTLIRASFTGDFSAFPSGYTAYEGIIRLDSRRVGGINFIRECSSVVDLEDGSPFVAKATLTVVSASLITVEAEIDYTLLDPNTSYYLSARLDAYNDSEAEILQENGMAILQEDLFAILQE